MEPEGRNTLLTSFPLSIHAVSILNIARFVFHSGSSYPRKIQGNSKLFENCHGRASEKCPFPDRMSALRTRIWKGPWLWRGRRGLAPSHTAVPSLPAASMGPSLLLPCWVCPPCGVRSFQEALPGGHATAVVSPVQVLLCIADMSACTCEELSPCSENR